MKLERVASAAVDGNLASADALLFASGYERRSRSVLSLVGSSKGVKLCLGFAEHQGVLSRTENDEAYVRAGVSIRVVSGAAAGAARDAVKEALEHVGDGGSLLVDITSMTRVWHAAIVSELVATGRRNRLRTIFVYVPSNFSSPPDDFQRTKHVCPLEGFTGFGLPNLPTALVVGLGYEPERAIGLQALLDPSATAACLASPADSRYYQAVLETNRDLLRFLPDGGIFEYPLSDPAATLQLIESLCAGLSRDFRVVLASLGPKIFGLLCLLLATMRPEVSVWRVSSGSGVPRDADADMGYASACCVDWVGS